MKTTRQLVVMLVSSSFATVVAHASAWLDFQGGSYTQQDANTVIGTAFFLDTVTYPNLAGPVGVTIVNTAGTGLDLNGVVTTNHRTGLSGLTDAPPGLYPTGVSPTNGSIFVISSSTAGGPLTNFVMTLDFSLLAGGGLPSGSFEYVADIDYVGSDESVRVGPNLSWIANFQMRDTASPDNPGTYSTATPLGPGSYLIQNGGSPSSGDWGAHALQTTAAMTSMTISYNATNGAGAGFGVVGVPEPAVNALALLGMCGLLARRRRS